MGTTPRSGLEGSSARPIRANGPLTGRWAKEPNQSRTNPARMLRRLPKVHPLLMRRVEHPAQPLRRLRRERLEFSVDLDRDRVRPLGQAAQVAAVLVLEARVQAAPGRIGHRGSMAREPKKACVRDRDRMPRVQPWVHVRRDLRVKAKRVPKVIVRNDSIVDRDPIEGRVLIVDHGLIVDRDPTGDRVPKALQLGIDRRVPKALAIVRNDSIADRDPTGDRGLIVDRDPITVGLVPKVAGRRMRAHPKEELRFRRRNLRRRNKPSPRSWFRLPNPRHRQNRCRTS
jgi:hypothetical protein